MHFYQQRRNTIKCRQYLRKHRKCVILLINQQNQSVAAYRRIIAFIFKAMHILQEENELQEIVRLVGQDALSPADRLTMETAKMLREDFLQQNAFVDEDAYSSYGKQFGLLGLILAFDEISREALTKGASMKGLFAIGAKEKIGRAKMIAPDKYEAEYAAIIAEMKAEIEEVIAGGEDA